MVMTLPNLLSVLRLCLVPVLLALGWFQFAQAYFWTLLFALGTDVADGYLARRWGQVSLRGARLDSRADRALFLSMPVGVSLLFPHLARHRALLVILLIGAYLVADIIEFFRGGGLTGQPAAQVLIRRPALVLPSTNLTICFPSNSPLALGLRSQGGKGNEHERL